MTDRTDDFQALVARARDDPTVQVTRAPRKPQAESVKTALARTKEFNGAASEVAHDIKRTSGQLQELTRLVQKKSIFDDKSGEINALTAAVKQGIAALNTKSAQLEQFVRQQQSTVGAKQAVVHSVKVVDQLQTSLAGTTKRFMGVLESRTEGMKGTQARMGQFGAPKRALGKPMLFAKPPPVAAAAGAAAEADTAPLLGGAVVGAGARGGGALSSAYNSGAMMRQRPGAQQAGSGGAGAALPRPGSSSGAHTQPEISVQQVQQLIPAQEYLQERANAMTDIEAHVAEVGQIFNKLGTLIHEQGEMVERIDDNVDSTVSNVESAKAELEKYWRSVGSNRMLVAKIFGVLMFFSVLMVLFM
jgi:syntaxin 5